MTQTLAILLDAYRELNHRKLFWIALALSGLVVVAVACIGVTDRGVSLLHWQIDITGVNDTVFPPATFYKMIFVGLGVSLWLAWVATILALITTAGIIPDLVSSGSIDLMVSKPISRARLFLTKFVGGLLFSTLQVAVFATASFLVIGLRGGVWEPGVFWAIPLVILFFSYLYSFCALVGLITRSTVASLLLTLLFWFACSMLWTAFVLVNTGRIANALDIASIERIISERRRDRGEQTDVSKLQSDLERAKSWEPFWVRISRIGEWVVTPIPKTAATIELLQRQLIEQADLPKPPDDNNESPFAGGRVRPRDLQKASIEWQGTFSPSWIIGTSLGFEVVILGLSCWIFSRRDY